LENVFKDIEKRLAVKIAKEIQRIGEVRPDLAHASFHIDYE